MKPSKLILTIATLAAGLSGANAAQLFTNGDMGTFGSGVPTGWNMQGSGANPAQSSDNSPFTNAYADNNSSFTMTRSGTGGGGSQVFSTTTNYQSITVNFDFMVTTLTTGDTPWGIQFDGGGVGTIAASAVHYRIDRNGQFAINAGSGGSTLSGINNIMSLDAEAWYNVQATFQVTANFDGTNPGAGFQSGTITKFGGSSASWNNVATLSTTRGYSRLLIYDRSATAQTGSLLVDNVSVVPEPSSALLLLGGSLLAFRRRRG
jgi:hypothetical protein